MFSETKLLKSLHCDQMSNMVIRPWTLDLERLYNAGWDNDIVEEIGKPPTPGTDHVIPWLLKVTGFDQLPIGDRIKEYVRITTPIETKQTEPPVIPQPKMPFQVKIHIRDCLKFIPADYQQIGNTLTFRKIRRNQVKLNKSSKSGNLKKVQATPLKVRNTNRSKFYWFKQ